MKRLIFVCIIFSVFGFAYTEIELNPADYQQYNFANDLPIADARILNDSAARDLGFIVGHKCFEACHSQRNGGFPMMRKPIGNRGELDNFIEKLGYPVKVDKQEVKAGSFVNSWYRHRFLNDGRIDSLVQQWELGTVGHELRDLDISLRDFASVQDLTEKAFGDGFLTQERAKLAVIWYEQNAISWNAPFQQWLRGERENLKYQNGFLLMLQNCIDCHEGILFGGNTVGSALANNPSELDSLLIPSLYSSFWKEKGQTYFHNAPSREEPVKRLKKAIRIHDLDSLGINEEELKQISKFVYWGLSDKTLGDRLCEPWTK